MPSQIHSVTDEGIVQIEYLFFFDGFLWLWIGPVRWILEQQDEMMVLGLKDHIDDYMYLHQI